MNCPTIDELSLYADDLLTEQEYNQIQNHLKTCEQCKKAVYAFMKEEIFIKETLQVPVLPDNFADSILQQLEPYEQKAVVQKRGSLWKKSLLSVAGIALAIGLTATFNPGFAEWIGGLFKTDQVDVGLRMAEEAGLTKRLNLQVEDEGITFKVEDIIIDSSRIALSYQVLNSNGKAQDTYFDMPDSNNKIDVYDKQGNKLDILSSVGWQEASDYGLFEFSLNDYVESEEIIIKFNLEKLNGVKGNWQLDVPVNLQEASKLTTVFSLADAKTSRHGVNIDLKEVRFAASTTDLLYETSFTEDERKKIENDIEKLQEKLDVDNLFSLANYDTALQYHIENEQKQAIYYYNTFFGNQGHTSDKGMLQSSGQDLEDAIGHSSWNTSFVPQKDNQKLTFVLDGVIKTVPSNFSITFQPDKLKNKPVSFEYEGNFITINKATMENDYSLRKSLIPVEKEAIFKIEMEGGKELASSDFGAWALVDDKGEAYEALHSGSILDEKDENGRFKTSIELKVYDMNEVPEEMTLHLLSVKRYQEVEDPWTVPLYK